MSAAICVQTERRKLTNIAADMRANLDRRQTACALSREWLTIQPMNRMAIMLLAGMDGDLSTLARKAWPEFTPNEKVACQVAIRSLYDGLRHTYALRVRVG